MTGQPLTAKDYPLAEKHPDRVRGRRGKTPGELTLEAAVAGDIAMDDLRITPEALLQQAAIARDVGRERLAANFERAAEMTRLPQDEIMAIYELLRPGRAEARAALVAAAHRLREEFDAPRLADFVEEAADMYDRRGLYRRRY